MVLVLREDRNWRRISVLAGFKDASLLVPCLSLSLTGHSGRTTQTLKSLTNELRWLKSPPMDRKSKTFVAGTFRTLQPLLRLLFAR